MRKAVSRFLVMTLVALSFAGGHGAAVAGVGQSHALAPHDHFGHAASHGGHVHDHGVPGHDQGPCGEQGCGEPDHPAHLCPHNLHQCCGSFAFLTGACTLEPLARSGKARFALEVAMLFGQDPQAPLRPPRAIV